MDLRVAAYAVVERRGKILLTHWRRGHLHGWTLPGGGLESGEDPKIAVVREVLEETGLEARVGKLIGVDSRVMVREEVPEGTDPELHTIRIVYRASVKDGPLQNEIDGSSDEARWVPIREIGSLRTLSLVQTGLRMAGISRRQPARSGKNSGKTGKASAKPGKSQGKPAAKAGKPRK
ncbi:NUDIX hydrolase [Leucobacter luti]|uniref:ADP-ribose pyrophosphatase YjhB (NUDIX family) n=1 Tax=Leucobacter luti TaxID=340320 RepID=A0A4R6S147_9MICO|nr:NUDIX domain-containing protein [Leucobacter luti]MCW2289350.1 ADP-ribose pyrophosphatase YjhB (NUDIX family) [Leucobacter luti]QYM74859.1 NUDIX domain-containing protein [Leucobacter luti]TCK39910.1 ADP-ribose pyrophosphatase YjhB (NUDIX family) [Leucobacter luti]TDP93231.1 ADP-ribose pyrophosphatase YjhB (NUDIX family) [Leucobacter luti]